MSHRALEKFMPIVIHSKVLNVTLYCLTPILKNSRVFKYCISEFDVHKYTTSTASHRLPLTQDV